MQYCVQFNCHVVLGHRIMIIQCLGISTRVVYSAGSKKADVFKLAAAYCINLKALTVSTVVNDS